MLFSSRKIAVSSWTWHDAFYKGEINLIDIPAKARQAGIGQVELNDFMLPPDPTSRAKKFFNNLLGYEIGNSKKQRYVQSTIDQLNVQLLANNVQCVSWSIDSDLTCSEEFWRKELAYIVKGVQTAVELNTQIVCLTLGGFERLGEEIDSLIVRRLKLVSAVCKTLFSTIQLVVKNSWGATTKIGRFLKIIERVADIGICFDLSCVRGPDREDDWSKLAAKARLCHLKIYDHDPEKLDQAIDYSKVFETLNSHGYAGKLVIEYEGANDPTKTIEAILLQLRQWPNLAMATKEDGNSASSVSL